MSAESRQAISQIGDPDLADGLISYKAQQAAKKGDIAGATDLAKTIKDDDIRDATLAYIAMKQ